MERTPYILAATAVVTLTSVAIAGSQMLNSASNSQADSVQTRWGANYFPNVKLTTHEGKDVYFFDDLIKDKVVMINFIFTSCPDSCPLETARLAQVADILHERVGKDVFIYSITIDPEVDTPEVLKDYAERYGAMPGWMFLTGKEDDIILLRKKLGLYIPEIQSESSTNHNLSLIIGNQKTGRWMKRSPFENPYILARQVGSWLHNWKEPDAKNNDFANAPKLRRISDGELLYRTRCAACHTIGGTVVGGGVRLNAKTMGPDLMGVSQRRDAKWLTRWIKEPNLMLKEKDPIATALFAQFNRVPMPNMRLTNLDVAAVMDFIKKESTRLAKRTTRKTARRGGLSVEHPWIKEGHNGAHVLAGYMNLVNKGEDTKTIVGVTSTVFETIEFHDATMTTIEALEIAPNAEVSLKPGERHMMLIGPKKTLKEGDRATLTFRFRSHKPWSVSFPVQK